MMQGDSYYLEIELLKATGERVTESEISDVEISVGNLIKRYSENTVVAAGGLWYFPLSQEESFQFRPAKVRVQGRVAWKDGGVEGVDLGEIRIGESIGKEVLGG